MTQLLTTWSTSFPVLLAVLLGGILFFFFYFRSRGSSSKKGDSLLLCGPSGSGKTFLFYRLCVDKSPSTIMSMKPSILEYTPKQLPVIDYPGHPRLRSLLYSKYLERAKQIVFMVDASNVQGQAREAAEFIYDLFTNPVIDNIKQFTIVCNKKDVGNARPHSRIKLTLQQELEKIKKTRKSLEESEDGSFVPLGRDDKPFNFDIDSPIEVTFCELSAKNDSIETIADTIGF